MAGREESIAIILRSFILPPGKEDDFPLAEPIPFRISAGTQLEELLVRIFADRVNQIGVVAVNGRVAEGKLPLMDGDRVDVFEILGGG